MTPLVALVLFENRPHSRVHNLAFFLCLVVVSGVISFVFASIRAEKRGPAPRVLGGSFLDDYFAFVCDLFGAWFFLGIMGALILQNIDREKLWTKLFGG